MLVNAVVYTFPPERADEAETLLLELRDASRAEAGCVAYDVARGIDDPAVFVLTKCGATKRRSTRTISRIISCGWA